MRARSGAVLRRPAVPVAAPGERENPAADPAEDIVPGAGAASPHRAGFVALVGLPGAGKSTLLNRLVGERLAIVSPKPQTTRRRILGVARRPGLELVLLDTPGIHRPRTGLGRAMMRTVTQSLGGADLALAVVDGTKPASGESAGLLRRLAGFPGPRILGINKADAAPPARLRELAAFYRERQAGEVLAFSARTGAGVESAGGAFREAGNTLLGCLSGLLPLGPPLFPDGQISDLPEAFFAAETVRERMLANLRQEVPHAAAVRIEEYDDGSDLVRIGASLLLDRDSQRGIVIGRSGRMLKRIGTEARLALEKRLRRRVFLDLQVRVRAGWRDNPRLLRDLGIG